MSVELDCENCHEPIRWSGETESWYHAGTESTWVECGTGDGSVAYPPDLDLILPDGTRYAGRYQFDADMRPVVQLATCLACDFTWNDALITALTPTPSGRCPNEYGHES